MGEGLLSVQRMLCAFDVLSQSSLESMFDIGLFEDSSAQSTTPLFSPNMRIMIDEELNYGARTRIMRNRNENRKC